MKEDIHIIEIFDSDKSHLIREKYLKCYQNGLEIDKHLASM